MRWGLIGTVTALWATGAGAAVTAEDVWAAGAAAWEALGLDVRGVPLRSGPQLLVDGVGGSALLPWGLGGIEVTAPDLLLTETGDGRVLWDWAEPAVFGAALHRPGEPTLLLQLAREWDGRRAEAAGAPGRVTFSTEAVRFDWSLTARWTGIGAPPFAAEGGSHASSDRDLRLVVGVTHRPDGPVGIALDRSSTTASFETRVPDPLSAAEERTVGTSRGEAVRLDLSLPPGGLALADLAHAVRSGAGLDLALAQDGMTSRTVLRSSDGERPINKSSVGANAFHLALDRRGFDMTSRAQGWRLSIDDAFPLPPFGLSGGEVEMAVAFPLLASDTRQPVSLVITLRDVAPDAATWAALDPGGAFPREPVTLDLEAGGEVTLLADLIDPVHLEALANSDLLPVEPHSFAVERLAFSGFGLGVSGRGVFSFETADLSTFPGWPRPQGQGSLTLTGAQAFLDRLVATGWISNAQTLPLRLWLAGLFRPTGPDEATAVLEVTPQGRALLNGQRLR